MPQIGTLLVEEVMNQTPDQVIFRTKLWADFVARYQVALITDPDGFAAFCATFRERWIAGR